MRILTVSAFFESHGGGVEIVAGALARALGHRGHDSRLMGAAFDAPPLASELTAVPLPSRDPIEALSGLPLPMPTAAARQRMKEEVQAADAVIVHDALYASSLVAARLATHHQKPWILIQHIGDIPYSSVLLRGALSLANQFVTKPMLARATQTVFISNTVHKYFENVEFRSTPKLLFNGVDNDLFKLPSQKEVAALRTRLGFPKNRTQLLFVGRFVEKKGLSIVRNVATLKPEWDFLMVGSGPIDPSAWQLHNVRVLGRKSRNELSQLYRASDALLLPSVGEGYPLVVQEAMATGLTVFCDMGSARADPDAENFLVGTAIDLRHPMGSARRLAENIQKHPLTRCAEAAEYARSQYNWDRNAEWIESRLLSILTQSPRKGSNSLRWEAHASQRQ